MTTSAPAACFSVAPSTLIAGNGNEEHVALMHPHAATAAVAPAPASRSVGVTVTAPTDVTGRKGKYLPLLPMV